MASILPPDISLTFIAALLIPLVIGFIVGLIAKTAIKIGIAIAILVIILIAIGFISPNQVIQPLVSLFKSGPALISYADRIAGYLPYSSLTFIVGLLIGFLKG